MKEYSKLILWWFVITTSWGVYRLLELPEFFSEVLAKPFIWFGITALFLSGKIIPTNVFVDLKKNYTELRPVWKTIVSPATFILFYFLILNLDIITVPSFSFIVVLMTLIINFSTGIVEEVIYRGIMYVWLLQKSNEVIAFVAVQALFLLGHVPVLVLNSEDLGKALIHAFYIILMGAIHTLIFRITRSIYASSLTHGLWNSFVYYFLLG